MPSLSPHVREVAVSSPAGRTRIGSRLVGDAIARLSEDLSVLVGEDEVPLPETATSEVARLLREEPEAPGWLFMSARDAYVGEGYPCPLEEAGVVSRCGEAALLVSVEGFHLEPVGWRVAALQVEGGGLLVVDGRGETQQVTDADQVELLRLHLAGVSRVTAVKGGFEATLHRPLLRLLQVLEGPGPVVVSPGPAGSPQESL